jgi:hypothetical protein
MNKHGTALAYATPAGDPVLSQRFTLEPHEVEAVEVRDMIAAEGVAGTGQAGLMVLPAMKSLDPAFIEWLTCGLLSIDECGIVSADADTVTWMKQVRENGTVW